MTSAGNKSEFSPSIPLYRNDSAAADIKESNVSKADSMDGFPRKVRSVTLCSPNVPSRMKPDGESETVTCSAPLPIETDGRSRDDMLKGWDRVMDFEV